jgi:Tol biopolymer transport system component
MTRAILAAVVAAVSLGLGTQKADPPVPFDVRYLGQKPPDSTPARFAPGIVSTAAMEINGVFTPDFREFVFARQVDGTFGLFHATLDGKRWSTPRPLRLYPGEAPGLAVDMAFSPDGLEMFFMGRFKPGVAPADATNSDIWVSRRKNGAWTTAEVVPAPVSTEVFESYPTVAADGSLYFISNRPGGAGRSDVYRAPRLPDLTFGTPVNIGRPPNTEGGEGDPFVSPDERYLIVTKDGEFGQADLFVSFRAADGKWSEPVNLGNTINTAATEFCPMVTPDGRYLFFSRRFGGDSWQTATEADVFWVDMAVVERLRRKD